jgi:uncharacterized protein (TIGR03437 family)
MNVLRLSLVLFSCLAAQAAVPVINSVTDSAGFGPRVAPGSLASIFGTGLASATTSANGFPLTTTLGGTSVSIAGTLAPLLYVSDGQINFQVPSSTASGTIGVVVNGPGGASASFNFTVTAQAPSIFQYGTNHALAQNADGSLNSDSSAAAAGSYVTVYLTGQGAVDNPVPDGTATPASPIATATATATATIGPMAATVQFLGLTSEFAGLAQANILVPALPTGDYPVVITAGGYIGASAVISVSGTGTAYTNPMTLVSSVAFSNSDVNNVAIYNNVAYVCGASRIVMINVSDVNTPSEIGEFGDSVLNGYGDRCAVNTLGSTPFLVDIVGQDSGTEENFAVYSLANPSSPSLLTIATTPYSHMEDLNFTIGGTGDNYGIVTTSYITYSTVNEEIISQEGDFLVFDFTNPAAPFLASAPPNGVSNASLAPYAEVVDQSYAFVASTTATGASTGGSALLNVVNLTLPTVPGTISQVTIPQAAILLSFDVAGTTLLAAGNTTGQRNPGTPDFDFTGYLTLTTMNLSSVTVPEVVATVTTQIQVNGTFDTTAFANGVFAIVNKPPTTDDFGPSSLMIVDARNSASIALYPYSTQFGFSGILTTNNGYLLAPTALGLNIYQLQLN